MTFLMSTTGRVPGEEYSESVIAPASRLRLSVDGGTIGGVACRAAARLAAVLGPGPAWAAVGPSLSSESTTMGLAEMTLRIRSGRIWSNRISL